MRLDPPVRILAAAGVLALALVGLVVRENVARDQGEEVRLALAGYDPRSLLQGHYVQFRLSETLPGRCPPGSDALRLGQPMWVALSRDGARHRPVGAATLRAQAARLSEVTARGWLSCRDAPTDVAADAAGAAAPAGAKAVIVDLELGVDRIHLEQAEAQAMEVELRRVPPGDGPPGYAVLSIGRDGRARVKGVIVGKRRVDLNWF